MCGPMVTSRSTSRATSRTAGTAQHRVSDEVAYVLHHYDFSETSLILELWTRQHGRVVVLAKGAKRPSSQWRPVLLPLQPLRVGWSGEGEVRTLKSVDWVGTHLMPQGAVLYSGYYVNELILSLLMRDDPHVQLFDGYSHTLQLLAEAPPDVHPAALRTFELFLLRELGWLPSLHQQTLTLTALEPANHYTLLPEAGLCLLLPSEVDDEDESHLGLAGAVWLQLHEAMQGTSAWTQTLHVCAEHARALRVPLQTLLYYHRGERPLRTRQLMQALQQL